MKTRPILKFLISILILVFACVQISNFFRNASSKTIIGWIILMAAIITLAIVRVRFPATDRFFNPISKLFWGFLFWYLLFILPFVPFRMLYALLSSSIPAWLQVLILILWGAFLVVAIWILVLEKKRVRLFNWLRQKVGIFAPFAYSFNLLLIGVYFFSAVTYSLVRSGVLQMIEPAAKDVTSLAIVDFYFWHFLDAVPVFKINNTLRWNEPLTYDNSWVGFLLLLLKIIVISPIIGAFIWYWRYVGKENAEENTKRQV